MNPEAEQALLYSYSITPISPSPGDGWRLRLYEYRGTVEERHFPVRPRGLAETLTWWHALTDWERAEQMTLFAGVTEAHSAYLVDVAYAEAETAAYAWLDARTGI